MRKRSATLVGVLLLVTALASAQTVYITRTGTRYHAAGCRHVSKSSIAIDLKDAVARGLLPCSVCNPPTLSKSKTAVPAVVPAVNAAAKHADQLLGEVVAVHDGDTLTLLVGTTQHKIRLNGIDAPELGQAYGSRARQLLADMCFRKTVTVRVVDVDRYGREVGDIYCGGVLVNAELVHAGMAWHYTQYSRDATLAALEAEARQAKRGLWADPNPTPPWQYRKE
jgi:endonuclease YncB( thermonuclease family)